MDMGMNEAVFDLIEFQAINAYFIEDAKKPAICICAGAFSPKGKYTLFFGRGIDAEGFSSLKKANEKAKEILSKTTKNIVVTKKKQGKIVERFTVRREAVEMTLEEGEKK